MGVGDNIDKNSFTGSMRLGETMHIARARTGSMCTSRRPDDAVDGGLLRRLRGGRCRRIRYRRCGRSRYGLGRRSRYGHGRRPGRRRVRRRRCRRRRADRWLVGGRARRRRSGQGVVDAPSPKARRGARALRLAAEIGRLVDHPWGTITRVGHGVREGRPRLLAADVAVRAVHAHVRGRELVRLEIRHLFRESRYLRLRLGRAARERDVRREGHGQHDDGGRRGESSSERPPAAGWATTVAGCVAMISRPARRRS